MKPKHFILSLLAFFASIAASAAEWTDANGTTWFFTIDGSGKAELYNDNSYSNCCISGTIPENLTPGNFPA